jgi:uncharacterized oxidoreductase
VIEAIILTGGMVGGFGGKAGRIAGAHSIHNGLTEANEVKHLLHGELVAYGILIQLALEGKDSELLKLLNYYNDFGLPLSLEQLTIDPDNQELLERIVKKALRPEESIHLMNQKVTEEDLYDAIKKVDKFSVSEVL